MQLKLTCQICEKKKKDIEVQLRSDNTIPLELLEITIESITKQKPLVIVSEKPLGETKLITKLSCGHSSITLRETTENNNLTSLNGVKKAYDYQNDGVKFGIESNYNCLIADEMGLGKTVQAELVAKDYIAKHPGDKIVIVIKSSTIYQFIREHLEWNDNSELSILPILTSKHPILPMFNTYIVSMDLLPDVVDKLITIQPKLVIADEVQSFKNPSSARSKALVKLIQEGNIKHKIFLSGTPIKNRASEFFTILNLLAPGHFPSYRQFVTRWLEPNSKGIPTRIRPYALDDFRRLTSRWIIRRELKDIAQDLPALRENVQEITIIDPVVKKSYNQQLDLFSNFLNHGGKIDSFSLLGWLTKLRRITAEAKVGECIELAKTFLDATEDEGTKLAIGIHHKGVRDMLFYGLEPYGALKLSGEDSAQDKDMIVSKFKSDGFRSLIINEVSGGVGLDGLQCCHNVFTLERQWSPADEEQFIKRFHRNGQQFPVLNTILMAHGTIDTFFEEMNIDKKGILKDTYGEYDITSDTQSLRELSQRVIEGRL